MVIKLRALLYPVGKGRRLSKYIFSYHFARNAFKRFPAQTCEEGFRLHI